MKKSHAHYVFLAFDIAAFYAIYYVAQVYGFIAFNAEQQLQEIEYQSTYPYFLLLAIIPIIHIWAIIEHFFTLSSVYKKWANQGLMALLFLLFLSGLLLGMQTRDLLQNAGYKYCEKKSEMVRLSEFRVYTLGSETCDQHQ
jgi:hypothetical protein